MKELIVTLGSWGITKESKFISLNLLTRHLSFYTLKTKFEYIINSITNNELILTLGTTKESKFDCSTPIKKTRVLLTLK